MGVEEGEFGVTPDFIQHISGLYRTTFGKHFDPMIPGEAQVYEPDGVTARAGRIAQKCEALLIELGLGEEVNRVRLEVITATKY